MSAIGNLGASELPWSNPLTIQRDLAMMAAKPFRKGSPQDLHVPEPDMTYYQQFKEWQDSLNVPETAPKPPRTITSELDFRSYGKTWNDRQIMSIPKAPLKAQDLKWDEEVKKKSKELEQNMSQEQKDMLANLDKYIAPSKLIEEGKKNNG